MVIDRTFCRTVRPRIEEALAVLGKELGVQFETGSASFDRDGKYATFKLKIATIGDDGEVVSEEAETFKQRAVLFGLKPEDLGREFTTWNGGTYKITGLKPRRRKYPISAERVSDGKPYKFAVDQVKSGLKANTK